nr:hypothetical protein [Paraburkholderia sp. UCT31]
MSIEIGLAYHVVRLRQPIRSGNGAIDCDETAVCVLNPRKVRYVVQDCRHACIRVSQLDRVLPQPLAHCVEGIHQLIELVAFDPQTPQAQRRQFGARRDAGRRCGDVQQMSSRQVVHDEQDEERDQECLGGVAQEDDDGLSGQVAIDVRTRSNPVFRASSLIA